MKKVIRGIIVLFVIIFIWHNSLQDAMHSEYASLAVVHLMQPLLATLGVTVSTGVLDALLRKVAHLSEFTLLGFVLCTSCSFFNGLNEKKVWVTLLIGLCVAVIDELLQRFSPGRSCQVSDMLLDWCGVWIGLGMAVGVGRIRAVLGRDKSRCKKKRL